MMINKKIMIPLCLVIASFTATGQHSFPFDAADKLFSEGKDFFELENYAGCIDKLEAYKKVATNRDLVQEADYMLAYIAYEQGAAYAREQLETYLKTYPDSRHGDEFCLLIGTCYFEQEDYVRTVNWLSDARMDALSAGQQEVLNYRLAYALLQNEDLETARHHFVQVRDYDSEYSQAATYYIAYIDYANGKYNEALREFNQLKRNPEYREQANYYIAQINYLEDNHDEVVKLATRLIRQYPDSKNNAELYRIAGNSYYQLGNQDKAILMLRNYVDVVETPARGELYLLGICEYHTGSYQKAVDALSQTINEEEDALTQNANLYLGHCYLQLKDENKARMAFEHAGSMTIDKKIQETALYNYALLIHETSFTGFGESVKVFEKFLNDFPHSEYTDQVNDYLVEVYLTSKNYEAALESINKIRQPSTKILEAKQNILFQLGNQAFMNTDMRTAIDYFDQAIAMGNYDVEARSNAYFWRGESYYRLGKYTDAIADFTMYQTVMRHSPANISSLVYYNLGYCYFKRQDFENALISLRRYVTLEKNQDANSYADAFNRIGDCLYHDRQFAEAETNYSRAVALQPSSADYATYQKGFVLGLQKDYRGKIRMMDQLIRDYPTSQYIDDALFERGRSYVLLDMYSDGASSFQTLMDRFPQSSLAPKAGVQLGLLYYNDNQLDKSIEAYKRVIDNYSGSEEAKVAVQDLKSVYIDKNDISSYASYVNSLDGSMHIEISEQDSLTYLAAERLFTRGDFDGAQRSMESYLNAFPQGAFSANANFYLAKIAFDRKNHTEAKRLFTLVLNSGDPKFREESLARKSEIEYLEKDYATALNTFRELQNVAESRENREAAKLGIMRCAQYTGNEAEALEAANQLLKEVNLSPEIEAEARYLRAKSHVKLGETNKAIDDFSALSKDTRTEYGAEAKYQLAQIYYDKKDVARAEKELLAFIDNGTPHQYWLARAFILLSDIYMDKGDDFQARQYLTNLKRNYNGSEDIDRMIENRMEKLKNK